MRSNRRGALLLLLTTLALPSCGGGINDTRPAATGNVSVALTDAPSSAFDNVWITVRAVWFHQVETAPFDNAATGWVRFPLDGGMTVNLAALAGDNNVLTVFDNLALPAATYRQMLLFLEPTENALAASAGAAGLGFNNQVDAGSLRAPLRVPNAVQGIRLAGTFVVAKDALLRLAIDFDVGRDVLPFNRGTVSEFLLQPRPAAFDLDDAGAIVGFIDNAAAQDNAALFEILAEQVDAKLDARVVRRAAAVDNATGRFVLYPLVPGATGSQRYDIVIRGAGWRTAIVNAVPVNAGTTPGAGATVLGTAASPIPMTAGTDFRIRASIAVPSGALANFYQTLGTDPPYLVRRANFDPLSGTIADFPLSDSEINVDTFVLADFNGGTIAFDVQSPTGGNGTYALVAEAPLFDPSASPAGGLPVNPSLATNPFAITGLSPSAPAAATSINVTANVPVIAGSLDNVILFATFGGTILNAQGLGPVAGGTAVENAIGGMPGGQPGTPFAPASYGVSAYGWTTGVDNVLRIGAPIALANPQTGPASAAVTMQKVVVP